MKPTRSGQLKTSSNEAGPPLAPLPRLTHQAYRIHHLLLTLVIALYIVFASIHAFHAPSGATGYQDAPDEEAHITYVRVVATGRLPTRDNPAESASNSRPAYEWHQPPLYYLLVAGLLPKGVLAMRMLSVIIGVAGIVVIYKAGRIFAPEHPHTAVLAAGIAALLPGRCAITSVMNNDGLLELCFSSFLLLLLLCADQGLSTRCSVKLGVVLGFALLTKVTAVLLLPVTVLALILMYRAGTSRSAIFRSALAISLMAVLISGWWYARNGILYHEWLPVTAFRESFSGTAQASDVVSGRLGLQVNGWLGYAALIAQWTFKSFFAVYSTPRGALLGVPTFLPGQIYLLAGLVVVGAFLGHVRRFTHSRTQLSRIQMCATWILAAAFGLVAFSFALFTSRYFQAQGRYFYPVILPIALLGSQGWGAVFPSRYANIASLLLLAYLCTFCIAFLWVTA